MLNDIYFVELALSGYSWIAIIFIVVLYNYLLVQLSPYIKKTLGKLYGKIVKRDKEIGFK